MTTAPLLGRASLARHVPRSFRGLGLLLAINALLWLGVGNAVVWGPLWWHWRIDTEAPAGTTLDVHRSRPDDAVLDLVADMSMTTDHPLRGAEAHAAAVELLRGRFVWPNLPTLRIGPDFSPRDLSQGVPVQQVFTASLIVPDLFLRAHAYSPDPRWVAAAWRYARGFMEYEAALAMPPGLERNAHAVANRASVLARLWRHLRSAPDYSPETGRLLHEHAQRIGALLSKPSTFIGSTNHGVMQNIGLLQLAVAFPELPRAEEWKRLAVRRLAMQLPWWIDPEGAVLEHSAGYHFHGVVLSGYVARLLELAGVPDEQWTQAHARARAFLAGLQRPDGSLPAYGNTYRYAWKLPPALGVDQAEWDRGLRQRDSFERYLEVGGHAVWWSADSVAGVATHTHLPFGHFPGHGHRRAQELSLLVWADGVDWSTNTGYWPSEDFAGIAAAEGWEGGNGPHVVGESGTTTRESRLVARGSGAGLRFMDLERSAVVATGGRLVIRRQVLQWQGSTWIVIDSHEDPLQRPLRVLWTAAPELEQRQLGSRSFHLRQPGSPVAMTLGIDGSPGLVATPIRGSREPFGGWVAFDRRASAAPAIDARLPPTGRRSWMVTTLHLQRSSAPASSAEPIAESGQPTTALRFDGPDDWTLRLEGLPGSRGGPVLVTRIDGELRIDSGAPAGIRLPETTLTLVPGARDETALRRIEDSRALLVEAYPRYSTGEWERMRLSQALLAGWLLSSVASIAGLFLVHHRRRSKSARRPPGLVTT